MGVPGWNPAACSVSTSSLESLLFSMPVIFEHDHPKQVLVFSKLCGLGLAVRFSIKSLYNSFSWMRFRWYILASFFVWKLMKYNPRKSWDIHRETGERLSTRQVYLWTGNSHSGLRCNAKTTKLIHWFSIKKNSEIPSRKWFCHEIQESFMTWASFV